MANKRGRPPKRDDGVGPTPERRQHGAIELSPHAIADEHGRPARPYRSVDTLAAMARKGTITPAMRQAGDDFHGIFVRAALDPLRAPDLQRIPQGGRDRDPMGERHDLRRRVWRTLEAVGGAASPAGSCIWHVLGCEWTVKDWALREGWGGRPLSQEHAAGVLVAALGVLQGLYGL